MKNLRIVWLAGFSFAVLSCFPGSLRAADAIAETRALLEAHKFSVEPDQMEKAAVTALVKLAHPAAQVFDASELEQFELRRKGQFYHAGIKLAYEKGALQIKAVEEESPAAKAGVKVGDSLLAIDGQSMVGVRLVECLRQLHRAEPGTLKLKVMQEEEVKTLDCDLASATLNSMEYARDLPCSFTYLKVNGLYASGAEKIIEALRQPMEKGCAGLLIDLRNANGSNLPAAAGIAGLFSAEPTVFEVLDDKGQVAKAYERAEGDRLSVPVMVLVNQRTSGASGLLAAALAEDGTGCLIIGEQPSGDLGTMELIPLSNGLQILLPIRKIVLASGITLGRGFTLKPDIVAEDRDLATVKPKPDNNPRRKKQDPQNEETQQLKLLVQHDAIYQRSIDVLLGLKALNIGTRTDHR